MPFTEDDMDLAKIKTEELSYETPHTPTPLQVRIRSNPCENCRTRRRKCTYDRPSCERCLKQGKECVYIRNIAPDDQQYERDLLLKESLPSTIDEVEQTIEEMEAQLNEYRTRAASQRLQPVQGSFASMDTRYKVSNPYCLPIIQSEASPPTSDHSSPPSLYEGVSSEESATEIESAARVQSETLRERNGRMYASPSSLGGSTSSSLQTQRTMSLDDAMHLQTFKTGLGWDIQVMDDGLRIQTNIRSYVDLLQQLLYPLRTSLQVLLSESKTPPSSLRFPPNVLHTQNSSIQSSISSGLPQAFQTTVLTKNRRSSGINHRVSKLLHGRMPEDLGTLPQSSQSAHINDHLTVELVKLHFLCSNIRNSDIDEKYYYNHWFNSQNPTNEPLTCAMVAMAAALPCQHTRRCSALQGLSLDSVCNVYFARSRQLLQDSFDEYSLRNMIAYLLLARCAWFSLRVKQSHQYRGLALNMAELLLRHEFNHKDAESRTVEHEMFVRNYWILLSLDLLVKKLSINQHEMSTFVDYIGRIGLPIPRLGESNSAVRAVIAQQHIISYRATYDTIIKRILAKNVSEVPLQTITEAEDALYLWYSNIPADFQLPTYLTLAPNQTFMDVLETCSSLDYHAFYLSAQFHSCLLRIHQFFLPDHSNPSKPPSQLALRSQAIALQCANIITDLARIHRRYEWCQYGLNGLFLVINVHHENSKSPNPFIRCEAKKGLELCQQIVERAFPDEKDAIFQDDFNSDDSTGESSGESDTRLRVLIKRSFASALQGSGIVSV
ncbi:hypothetical protein BZG36_04673 [Bifiguratus adelaidae]|uniref:Zn(2)-C6 fungal-type domain-containing protein n=1 Tax=Bifiguratus adelaidae TaxID=1938954 RepID=A0A261XWJ7_9FUNG|nr:hypothetical protein BZG36_04673 [Bifiguratus adelaidae]